ncbi:MAG: helix-turn-helix domain-containing protein, partial [Halobacteriota archaeon]
MADSISNQLQRDMACEGLLECIHGLKQLDKECFRVLVESDRPLSIDEISERVGRERSTAYRSLQRLHDAGFIQRDQINYDDGGYY